MANEQAVRDNNRVPGLVIHDSTGAETRQVRATSANPNAIPVEILGSGTGADSSQVQGTAAHDAAATGNPLLEGGYASDAAPTDVADGDAVRAWNKRNGARAVYDAYSRDEDTDAITAYTKSVTPTTVSADAVISAVPVGLVGYYVASSSSGTISIYDNASAASGTTMLATAKSVSANDLVFLDSPIAMTNGVYLDITNTATVTIFTRKLTAQ